MSFSRISLGPGHTVLKLKANKRNTNCQTSRHIEGNRRKLRSRGSKTVLFCPIRISGFLPNWISLSHVIILKVRHRLRHCFECTWVDHCTGWVWNVTTFKHNSLTCYHTVKALHSYNTEVLARLLWQVRSKRVECSQIRAMHLKLVTSESLIKLYLTLHH